jgi:hypothetical protein
MKLVQNGIQLFPQTVVLKESFSLYAAELHLTIQQDLTGTITLEDTAAPSTEFTTVEGKKLTGGINYYKLLPKNYCNYLNKAYGPFQGTKDTQSLVKQFGIETSTFIKTENVYWNFPLLKYKNFANIFNTRSKVNGGGGVASTISADGKLCLIDLKTIADKAAAVSIYGSILADRFNVEWVNEHTGEIHFVQNTVSGVTETDLTFLKGWGKSRKTEFIYNEQEKNVSAEVMRNAFWTAYHTSREIQVSNVKIADKISIGKYVSLQEVGISGICWGLETSVGQQVTNLNMIIVSKP